MHQTEHIEKRPSGNDNTGINEQKRSHHYTKLVIGGILWLLAVALMITLSLFAHAHPQPIPFELTASRDVQALSFPPSSTGNYEVVYGHQ